VLVSIPCTTTKQVFFVHCKKPLSTQKIYRIRGSKPKTAYFVEYSTTTYDYKRAKK